MSKLINEEMFKYISIRQLIWNFIGARADGSVGYIDNTVEIFDRVDELLFQLIVGVELNENKVWASVRGGVEELPIMREKLRPGAWESCSLFVNEIHSLRFLEFFSWNRYGFNLPDSIRCEARLHGGAEKKFDVLVSSYLVDFVLKDDA